MIVRELDGKAEMLNYLSVMQELYPSLTLEDYDTDLTAMIFEGDDCLGIAGYWIGTKLWCGKYLEIDNMVVSSKFRSRGVGKLIFNYLNEKAKEEGCSMMALDSYTANFKAHKFFYNEGFGPKGFHFIRILEEDMIR